MSARTRGWEVTSGTTQQFASHAACGPMYGQRADGRWSRYHVRVRRTAQADPRWGITAVGTPHHEDWITTCGHAVDRGGGSTGEASGFDQGRQRVHEALRGTHHTFAGSTYWGNTRQFRQCDGDWAGSNGYVHWWSVAEAYHQG